MHKLLQDIPTHILENAVAVLKQANKHACFFDPGNENWGSMSVVNAAHAGELVMKAVIAKVHPLLIFRNLFELDEGSAELSIERVLEKAKSHDFQHLPSLMWAVTGDRLSDVENFEEIRKIRNSIQHFYHPHGFEHFGQRARDISLKFIYNNIDPLLNKYWVMPS